MEVMIHRRINSESDKAREDDTDSELDLSISIQVSSSDYSSTSLLAGKVRDSNVKTKNRFLRGTGINSK